jgi:hypothetical protein
MTMKKLIRVILPVLCVVLLFASCKPKIKQVNGRVTYFRQDTIKVMVDGDEETYLTDGAQILGGMPMVKDSVEIMRIKDRVQIMRLIPPKGHIIDIHKDTTKVVMTKPMKKGEKEKLEKFVQLEKKRMHQK